MITSQKSIAICKNIEVLVTFIGYKKTLMRLSNLKYYLSSHSLGANTMLVNKPNICFELIWTGALRPVEFAILFFIISCKMLLGSISGSLITLLCLSMVSIVVNILNDFSYLKTLGQKLKILSLRLPSYEFECVCVCV